MDKYGKEFDREIDGQLSEIFVKLDHFFGKHNPEGKGLPDRFFKELKHSFKEAYVLYKEYLAMIPKNTTLYLAANNNTWSRTLSAAVRKKGGEVHGFSHGEPLVYNWEKIAWMELSLSDVYHEYSENLAALLKDTVQEFRPPNDNRCRISFQENPAFKKVWDQSKKRKQHSTSLKKVMLIGNAYRHDSFSSVTAFPSVLQYHLERQIIYQLIKGGFKVVYQKHPGGFFKNKMIDFKIDGPLQVNDKPFEQSMNLAESFLFYYTRTTTFGPAICSSKPVIIVDGGWEVIQPKLKKELETRCRFVQNISVKNGVFYVEPFEKNVFSEASEKATDSLFFESYLI